MIEPKRQYELRKLKLVLALVSQWQHRIYLPIMIRRSTGQQKHNIISYNTRKKCFSNIRDITM